MFIPSVLFCSSNIVCITTLGFYMCSETWTWSLMFARQVFYWLSHFPSLVSGVFIETYHFLYCTKGDKTWLCSNASGHMREMSWLKRGWLRDSPAQRAGRVCKSWHDRLPGPLVSLRKKRNHKILFVFFKRYRNHGIQNHSTHTHPSKGCWIHSRKSACAPREGFST